MSDVDGVRLGGVALLRAGLATLRGRASRLAGMVRPGGGRALLPYAMMPALSGMNAIVGLLLPALLGPTAFGQYAIAVTLFQYGLICDLGISQLVDRRLPVLLAAGDAGQQVRFASDALWVRFYVAGGTMAAGAACLAGLAATGRLPFDLGAGVLSLAAGLLFMLALGPMSIDRAMSRRREFVLASVACNSVLAVARPMGVLLGGTTGCFAALAALYAVVAGRILSGREWTTGGRPGVRRSLHLLAQGTPLFATSFVWAFYMTANRWVVSFLAPDLELGHFAFGANITYLVVGTIAALAQLYYPGVTKRAALLGAFSVSRAVARDLCGLMVLMVPVAAVGIVAGPVLIEVFYHKFAGAEIPMRVLLSAVPALVVASWLMPLSLSAAARPWIDGAVVYPLALAVLMVGTWAGYRAGGIAGASWGLPASALPLLALQLARLRLARVVTWADAGWLLLATTTATGLLAALAW